MYMHGEEKIEKKQKRKKYILLGRYIILMSKIRKKSWDVESDVKWYGINDKVGFEMIK